MSIEQDYIARKKRVKTAVALQEADRVPFLPNISSEYFVCNYGINMYEAMKDPLLMKNSYKSYLLEIEPDLTGPPALFPVKPLETSKFSCGRWPGPYYGLPEDIAYQYIDKEYLHDDCYEEFFKDPSRFILHKILPIKHEAFKPFERIEPYMMCDSAIYGFAAFAAPDFLDAIEAFVQTAKQTAEYLDKAAELGKMATEMGFPDFGAGSVMAPFDEFADHVRGILQACYDCVAAPEDIKRAVDLWGDVTIPLRVNMAKANGAEYVMMPLHCGVDNFMSRESYENIYWPGLRRAIHMIVENDMTPYVFCEGKYNTRLEILRDVPKGKVIYLFEDVDMKEAKRILGDVACIAGGMSSDLLMHFSAEKVIDKTKEIIDICAPGGGFIMSNGSSLFQANTENVRVWKETLFEYGKY